MDRSNGVKPPVNQSTSTHWWRRRSFLEQILFAIALVSSILCIATIIIIIILTFNITSNNDPKLIKSENNHKQNVCLTPGCVKAAAEILNYINISIDPCDDFYSFACGNWLKKTVIREEEGSVSSWVAYSKVLRYRLRELIENMSDDSPPFLLNVKAFYDACKNESELNRLGSEPLMKVIQKLGGWPVVANKNWNPDSFHWVESLKILRKLGLDHNTFISLFVKSDMRNNTHYIIELNQPDLGIDYTYLLKGHNDSVVSAYYNLMVESAVLLGAEQQEAEMEMMNTLKFEMELAKIIIPREERRNMSQHYNKMNVSDLQRLVPQIPWKIYLEVLLNESISSSEEIVVRTPKYIINLNTILGSNFRSSIIKSEQSRIIANYMIWRVVLDSMTFLSKTWRNLYQKFTAVLTGRVREKDRWQQCLQRVSYELPKALGSIYAQVYLNLEKRNQVTSIAKHVLNTFLETLENLQWMDPNTREKAKEKANNMLMYIGYPDELLDNNLLSEFHVDLHSLDPMNHYENHKRLTKWSNNHDYGKLRKQKKRGDWENWYGIAHVNAFYHPRENALEIPGGLFQSLFFSPDKPNYLNFGAIGSIIGHELTHGFDDEGRQFDALGNNFNWWEEQTEENFKKRAKCMIYQYGNYTHPTVNMAVNGINTLGENIADNAAPKQAYWAYKKWIAENGEEPMLPALKYTPTQLFWIGATIVDCEKHRPQNLRYQIMVDSHSPSLNRVVGTVSNSIEFAKEFNCQAGSPMNPKNKCIVW